MAALRSGYWVETGLHSIAARDVGCGEETIFMKSPWAFGNTSLETKENSAAKGWRCVSLVPRAWKHRRQVASLVCSKPCKEKPNHYNIVGRSFCPCFSRKQPGEIQLRPSLWNIFHPSICLQIVLLYPFKYCLKLGSLEAQPATRGFVPLLIEGVLSGETYTKQAKENKTGELPKSKDGISAEV